MSALSISGVVVIVIGVPLFVWACEQAGSVGEYPRYLLTEEVARGAAAERGQFQAFQLVGPLLTLHGLASRRSQRSTSFE